MRRHTRGQRNINWIEAYCRIPAGPQRGEKVTLSKTQRDIICKLYDDGGEVEPISGHLAAYVALLHLCGVEYGSPMPVLTNDVFTTWNATSEKLRDVLRHEGEVIVCPELGTSYPNRAA